MSKDDHITVKGTKEASGEPGAPREMEIVGEKGPPRESKSAFGYFVVCSRKSCNT